MPAGILSGPSASVKAAAPAAPLRPGPEGLESGRERKAAVPRSQVRRARRIVVKVGSSLLAPGGELDRKVIGALAKQVAALVAGGRELLLVTSGAISAGLKPLGLLKRPGELPLLQAAAAAGQGLLMHAYQIAFSRCNLVAAQILITRDGLDGREPEVLLRLLEGEELGTLFRAGGEKLAARKRWLAFGHRPSGRIVIDDGAARALVEKHRSLLPIGVLGAEGAFPAGASVSIVTRRGREVARGISNYSAADVERIKGRQTDALAGIVGEVRFDEVVHRDNLTVL